MQLSCYFLFFFPLSLCCIFASALLLCNWHCVSSGRLALESECWGTGDMSTAGTMKLPVWLDQSVCKHRGAGWGVPTHSGLQPPVFKWDKHTAPTPLPCILFFLCFFLPSASLLKGEGQQCVQDLLLFSWSFFNVFISWNGISLFILQGRERII